MSLHGWQSQPLTRNVGVFFVLFSFYMHSTQIKIAGAANTDDRFFFKQSGILSASVPWSGFWSVCLWLHSKSSFSLCATPAADPTSKLRTQRLLTLESRQIGYTFTLGLDLALAAATVTYEHDGTTKDRDDDQRNQYDNHNLGCKGQFVFLCRSWGRRGHFWGRRGHFWSRRGHFWGLRLECSLTQHHKLIGQQRFDYKRVIDNVKDQLIIRRVSLCLEHAAFNIESPIERFSVEWLIYQVEVQNFTLFWSVPEICYAKNVSADCKVASHRKVISASLYSGTQKFHCWAVIELYPAHSLFTRTARKDYQTLSHLQLHRIPPNLCWKRNSGSSIQLITPIFGLQIVKFDPFDHQAWKVRYQKKLLRASVIKRLY